MGCSLSSFLFSLIKPSTLYVRIFRLFSGAFSGKRFIGKKVVIGLWHKIKDTSETRASFHFLNEIHKKRYITLRKKMNPNAMPMYENRLVFSGETRHDKNELKSNKIAIIFVANIMFLTIPRNTVILFLEIFLPN